MRLSFPMFAYFITHYINIDCKFLTDLKYLFGKNGGSIFKICKKLLKLFFYNVASSLIFEFRFFITCISLCLPIYYLFMDRNNYIINITII